MTGFALAIVMVYVASVLRIITAHETVELMAGISLFLIALVFTEAFDKECKKRGGM